MILWNLTEWTEINKITENIIFDPILASLSTFLFPNIFFRSFYIY